MPAGKPLHFPLGGIGQTQQSLSLLTGQVLGQELLAVQKDAALAFNEEGAHGLGKRPLAPGGGRPGCWLKHFRPQ